MEGLELISFQIISAVGTARSMYIEAVEEAKAGHIADARKMVAEGEEIFVEGHKAHGTLIQKEAAGEAVVPQLLLVHAEDQLMSAEGFKTIANQMIDLYELLYTNNLLKGE